MTGPEGIWGQTCDPGCSKGPELVFHKSLSDSLLPASFSSMGVPSLYLLNHVPRVPL